LESFEKSKKKKREVTKVRVQLKSNDIPDVKHNCYAMSSTPIAWQTDLFIRIALAYALRPNVRLAAHQLQPICCHQHLGSEIDTA